MCVDALHITYNPATAALYRRLSLVHAGLHLARLEVDGPNSLVALADVLPRLVALTHLRACICVHSSYSSGQYGWSTGQFIAHNYYSDWWKVPHLQQRCPGLKSLRLDLVYSSPPTRSTKLYVPVAQLLPDHLEQLHLDVGDPSSTVRITCATLTPYTSLSHLTLARTTVPDLDQLFFMPALKEVNLHSVLCVDEPEAYAWYPTAAQEWVTTGLFTTAQHVSKLTGLDITALDPDLFTPAGLHTALRELRTLHLDLSEPSRHMPFDATHVQQLLGLRHLQHLSLSIGASVEGSEQMLSALSTAQQLTYLCLRGHMEVPACTWAAVLPHLTRLRVLSVGEGLLLRGGLAAELPRLARLQCVYVGYGDRDAAAEWAYTADQLQVLSACSSLRAVLCWWGTRDDDTAACPMWEYVRERRLHLSCWYGWRAFSEEGRVVCPRAAPHLPGVWELQQEVADGLSSD